jgi:hypothetical protein
MSASLKCGPSHSGRENVLEEDLVREAVGIVDDGEKLDQIVTRLTTNGFDRADIDLMASRVTIFQKLGIYADPIVAAEASEAPRERLVTGDEVVTASALIFGTLITIGSLGAALPIVASGGALASAAAVALAGGALGGGLARVIRNHVVGRENADDLESDLKNGGLAVFVRVRNLENEGLALSILQDCGARNVHVHEVALEKTLRDIPLAEINPDPLLDVD